MLFLKDFLFSLVISQQNEQGVVGVVIHDVRIIADRTPKQEDHLPIVLERVALAVAENVEPGVSGRTIPSLCILALKVLGWRPRIAAAPSFPSMRHLFFPNFLAYRSMKAWTIRGRTFLF